MNWTGLLYDPCYAAFGVDATTDIDVDDPTLRVIDKTAGLEDGGAVSVDTVLPGATVRAAEVQAKGMTKNTLDRCKITFNDSTWTVVAVRPKPSPGGEMDGEYYLVLEEAAP